MEAYFPACPDVVVPGRDAVPFAAPWVTTRTPAVFSGPPESIDGNSSVKLAASRIEVRGFIANITVDGHPFVFLRNDGTVPDFLIIEFDKARVVELTGLSTYPTTRLWYYHNGALAT